MKKASTKIIKFLSYANSDAGSNEFLKYMSANLAILVVGILISGLSYYQSVYMGEHTSLVQGRQIICAVLIAVWFLTLPLGADTREKVIRQFAFSILAMGMFILDLAYLLLDWPFKQNVIFDVIYSVLSILMVAYFIYITIRFVKKVAMQIHHIFKEITKSEAVGGLQRTLEAITSVVLALGSLLAGVATFSLTFKELIKNLLL